MWYDIAELIDGKVNYVDIPSIGVNNATGNQLLEFINTVIFYFIQQVTFFAIRRSFDYRQQL